MIRIRLVLATALSVALSASALALASRPERRTLVDPEVPTLYPRISPAVGVLLQDGSDCARDSHLLLDHLSNNTAWAVAMVDASAPGPQGVLRGSTIQFGDFDECLALEGRGSPVGPQFCVITLTAERPPLPLPLPSGSSNVSSVTWTSIDEVSPYADVRQVVQGVGQHFVAPSLHEFGSGVCVPRSCSPRQLSRAVAILLRRQVSPLTNALRLRASVQPGLCTTHQEAVAGSRGRAWLLWAAATLSLLLFIGTAVDPEETTDSTVGVIRRILSAWSVRRNMARLTVPMRPLHGMDMTSVGGARVLMACGVIAFHHQGARESLPSSASRYILTGSSAVLRQSMSSALFAIDSFFFVSGLFFIPTFKSDPVRSILHRISRFIPLFIVVTAFNFFVYPYLGSGPFWKAHSEAVVEVCRHNWWKNFLFLSSNNEKCGVHLWSAAADVQLYVLATIVSSLCVRLFNRPSLGVLEAGLAVIASAAVRFIIAFRERWTPAIFITAQLHRTVADKDFWSMYGSASSHLIPYVCGIVVGSSLLNLHQNGVTLSKSQTRVCSLVALALVPVLTEWNFHEWYYGDGSPTTAAPLRSSLVIVSSQLLLALLWTLLAVINSPLAHPNAMRQVLSSAIFPPLSRISFMTYAAHWFPILFKYFSIRAPVDPSLLSDVYDGVGHVIMGFSWGFFLYLTLEGPFGELQAMFSGRPSKSDETVVPHANDFVNRCGAMKLRSE